MRNQPLRNILFVLMMVFVSIGSISLSGCSVFMATRQPDYKNLNVLNPQTPRASVVAELGAPVLTEERDGQKVDVFAFKQGYGKGNKVGRALFHGTADIFSFGLWEVIGTPAEAIANGRDLKIEVFYDKNNQVESVNYLQGKK